MVKLDYLNQLIGRVDKEVDQNNSNASILTDSDNDMSLPLAAAQAEASAKEAEGKVKQLRELSRAHPSRVCRKMRTCRNKHLEDDPSCEICERQMHRTKPCMGISKLQMSQIEAMSYPIICPACRDNYKLVPRNPDEKLDVPLEADLRLEVEMMSDLNSAQKEEIEAIKALNAGLRKLVAERNPTTNPIPKGSVTGLNPKNPEEAMEIRLTTKINAMGAKLEKII